MPDDQDIQDQTGRPDDTQSPPPTIAGMNQPLEGGGIPQAMPTPMPIAQPPSPTVSQQAQRHGGLLTGLAGVLLDGLTGGMMAQANAPLYGAPGSTFARGFLNQQQMPLIRQQQQQQMWEAMSKEEQDKATMALAQMDQLKYHMQSMRLRDEINVGLMEDDYQMVEGAIADNAAEILATTSGPNARAEAANMVADLNAKDPSGKQSYWLFPKGHTTDAEGKPVDIPYQVVRIDPNAPLKHPMTIAYPARDPLTGEVSMKTFTVQAPATYRDFMSVRESMKANATAALKPSAGEEAAARKAAETNVVAALPDGTQRVMTQAEADRAGYDHFTLKDPMQIQQTGFRLNEVQQKFNQLAQVNFANVQPELAAALIEKDAPELKGLIHIQVPERYAAGLREENLRAANQDTKDYVVAIAAADEAITQLPGLQTFGRTNRFNLAQVDAAKKMLPLPGDTSDPGLVRQKLASLQGSIEPLRQGLPRMEGVTLTKSFLEGGQALPGTVLGGQRPAGAAKIGVDKNTGRRWYLDKDNKPLAPVAE